MSKRSKKSTAPTGERAGSRRPPATGWKLWTFRAVAALAVPAALLLLVEGGLRLAGVGYPTGFLLKQSSRGQATFAQNNQFGWRFFGPQMARNPEPFSIPAAKPADTVRIFVFGESAAFGDPQPEFGLPRMLQALLSLRYPGARFEVVNAAMTGINSHAILPIARDCAQAGGDLWVIYMGNNEVVGPFGAGTVFGPQAPPLPLVRASLALKATRLGQVLDAARRRWQSPASGSGEWGGMRMFLDQQVGADEPRLAQVYRNFAQNLADILQAGRRAGAGIVVSTVAVNLKDSAPFASRHRPGLSDTDRAAWDKACNQAVAAQATGDFASAAREFQVAAQLDDRCADLRFRQAQCALALGDAARAQLEFTAARELDTLRFRCDSWLNELVRQSVAAANDPRILLADADKAFAEASPGRLPGTDWFYEHVHLTFHGNYLLARTIAAQMEQLLPPPVLAKVTQVWPLETDCAQRLAWTGWAEKAALAEIIGRITRPPFTGQLTHTSQLQRVQARLASLAADPNAAIPEARERLEAALAAAPDDPVLHASLARVEMAAQRPAAAEPPARRAVQLLPSSGADWSLLGGVLAAQRHLDEALPVFQEAFRLDPQDVAALAREAEVLKALGRREEAIRQFRRAVAIKPRDGPAWLGLGQLLEESGQRPAAEDCYQRAVANPVNQPAELAALARFCQNRGWYAAAVTNYLGAITLSPPDPLQHLALGQCYTALNRRAEAKQQYAEAARLAPGLVPAHYLLGLELAREGSLAGAEEQFRLAVQLAPDLAEARLNLGLVLKNAGRPAEARAEFEAVLKRDPANRLAAEYLQSLPGTLPR